MMPTRRTCLQHCPGINFEHDQCVPRGRQTHCLQYGASTDMRSIEKFMWLLEVLYKEEGDQ
uniref:Uncharacterized protein n=1 Tax=Oryza nivara TaxID=4536 RepID=A0A0E0FVI3_ORYNI